MSITMYVAYACVCGVIGSMIFQSKNRPPYQGAVIGLVFGVFGILFLALYRKLDPPARPAA